jgi:hypothetical protein
VATSWRYTCRYRRVPTKHKRELSGSASPRDRRLGKWTALLAGCLLRAGRPDGALREVRLAYLRDPNVDIANWGGKP